jgi:hypothetical protein
MSRFLRLVPLGLAAALAASPEAHAQAAPSSPINPVPLATKGAADTNAVPTPAPRRNRAISPEAAAALAAVAPKFAPPPPKPEKKPEDEVDAREVDKPKNGIIRLPKYVVREAKPPIFSEREIHTKQGLAELAIRRYLSETDQVLNRFHLPFLSASNEERAMMMYAEDERLRKMSDTADLANMADKSVPEPGRFVRKIADETYMREPQFARPGSAPR